MPHDSLTDAELSSALAHLLAHLTETMVMLVEARDAVAADRNNAVNSVHLADALHERDIALLQTALDRKTRLIRQLTEAGKLLEKERDVARGTNEVLREHVKRLIAKTVDAWTESRDLGKSIELLGLNARLEREEQRKLRIEGLEDLLRRWLLAMSVFQVIAEPLAGLVKETLATLPPYAKPEPYVGQRVEVMVAWMPSEIYHGRITGIQNDGKVSVALGGFGSMAHIEYFDERPDMPMKGSTWLVCWPEEYTHTHDIKTDGHHTSSQAQMGPDKVS